MSWAQFPLEIRQKIITEVINAVTPSQGFKDYFLEDMHPLCCVSYSFSSDDCLVPFDQEAACVTRRLDELEDLLA